MCRSLIVGTLLIIFLVQDALASQVPNARTEASVNPMSMPRTANAQSSYFEETKRGFSRWVKESPELKSKDELENLCLAGYTLLKAYTDNKDDPEVVENVLRIRKILTH